MRVMAMIAPGIFAFGTEAEVAAMAQGLMLVDENPLLTATDGVTRKALTQWHTS